MVSGTSWHTVQRSPSRYPKPSTSFSRSGDSQRRLPEPERLDPGSRPRRPPGHGVDTRRRVRERLRGRRPVRRGPLPRDGVVCVTMTTVSAATASSSWTTPVPTADCSTRWRPWSGSRRTSPPSAVIRQCHDIRRVRRGVQHRDAVVDADGRRLVPQGDPPERSRTSRPVGRHGSHGVGRAGSAAQRGADPGGFRGRASGPPRRRPETAFGRYRPEPRPEPVARDHRQPDGLRTGSGRAARARQAHRRHCQRERPSRRSSRRHQPDEHRLFLVPTGVADATATPPCRWSRRARARCAGAGDLQDGRAERRDALAAMLTDWFYRIPAIRLAEAHQGHSYMYEFGWNSPVFGRRLGACHALEIGFMFDTLDAEGSEALYGSSPPAELAAAMHKAWIDFAQSAGLVRMPEAWIAAPPWPSTSTTPSFRPTARPARPSRRVSMSGCATSTEFPLAQV